MSSSRSGATARTNGSAGDQPPPGPVFRRALRAQAPTQEPETPGLAQRAVGALFGAISALRGARSLHPDGVVFEGTFTVPAPNSSVRGAPLLEGPGSHPAVVRLSRSVGLPQPLPDIHGLTVRLVDVHGPGRHQDFPLATSGDGALLHHLLLPTRGFSSLPYSSVLLYRIGPDLRLVGARVSGTSGGGGTDFDRLLRAIADGDASFELAVASPLGRWQPVGRLVLGEQVPLPEAERIRFNPWNTGGGIRPVGPLMGLRAGAYRGSQAGWSADPG